MKILLIDDEQDILEILNDEFSHAGHEVMSFPSFAQAIEEGQLKDFRPEHILCDYNLRGLKFSDAVTTLNQLFPDSKVYCFSGEEALPQDILERIDGHLVKPLTFTEILKILKA